MSTEIPNDLCLHEPVAGQPVAPSERKGIEVIPEGLAWSPPEGFYDYTHPMNHSAPKGPESRIRRTSRKLGSFVKNFLEQATKDTERR